jgi:Flp pilus assembly protein TadG
MKRAMIDRWARRLRDSESGQALVEVSVAGTLLVVIVLGVIEFGQLAYDSIEVSNAAKAGVQYGTQNGATASDTTGIQNAAAAAATDVTGLTATSSYSCTCSDGSSSTCQNTDCPNSHLEEVLTVNTQATVTPMVRIPGLPSSFTVTGKAIQQCTQ